MNTEKLIKQLVSIPSVTNDIKAVNQAVLFSAQYLRNAGLHVAVEKVNGYKVLFASTVPGKKVELLFNAHLDVVPATGEASFKVVQKRSHLVGRGVSDCKATCAILLNLLPALKGKANVGVLFSSDEETGGVTAAAMVKRGYRGRYVVILDGGMGRLTIGQKGILSLTLTAEGRACHAATPWRGDNPIEKLFKGYMKVKALFPKASEKNNWHDTIAATVIQGGEVVNQVPSEATLAVNIRFTEKTDPKKLLQKIKKVSGLKVTLNRLDPYVGVDANHPFVQQFLKALRKTTDPKTKLSRMNGATDARHFVDVAEAVVITGIKGGHAHMATEWLDLPSVVVLEKALYNFSMSIARI